MYQEKYDFLRVMRLLYWTMSLYWIWREIALILYLILLRYVFHLSFVVLCVRLTRDPKSNNFRVYLKDGEVSRPVAVRTRVSGGNRSSNVTCQRSAQLSSVMKNKTRTGSSQSPQPVCDAYWYNCSHSHAVTEFWFTLYEWRFSKSKLFSCYREIAHQRRVSKVKLANIILQISSLRSINQSINQSINESFNFQ